MFRLQLSSLEMVLNLKVCPSMNPSRTGNFKDGFIAKLINFSRLKLV